MSLSPAARSLLSLLDADEDADDALELAHALLMADEEEDFWAVVEAARELVPVLELRGQIKAAAQQSRDLRTAAGELPSFDQEKKPAGMTNKEFLILQQDSARALTARADLVDVWVRTEQSRLDALIGTDTEDEDEEN